MENDPDQLPDGMSRECALMGPVDYPPQAGDFEEWSSDTGVLVDAALIAIRGRCSSDAEAYRITIPQLPDLLDNIMERQDLWGDAKEAMDEALQALASGRISSEQQGSIGMVVHAPGTAMIPGVVLSRLFSGAEGVRRYLLAQEQEDGCFSYSYQRPGYSWAVTRNRPR